MGTGMDFLKSCIVNLTQPTGSSSGIQSTVFTLPPVLSEESSPPETGIYGRGAGRLADEKIWALVEQGILVWKEAEEDRLWLFNAPDGIQGELEACGYSFVRHDHIEARQLAELPRRSPPDTAHAQAFDFYTRAAAQSFGKSLSKSHDVIPLCSTSWIVPIHDEACSERNGFQDWSKGSNVLVSLISRICIDGSILLVANVDNSRIVNSLGLSSGERSSNACIGHNALLAPYGARAVFTNDPSDHASSAPTPTGLKRTAGQERRLARAGLARQRRHNQWKDAVRSRLRKHFPYALSLHACADSSRWIWMSPGSDGGGFKDNAARPYLWPAALCFGTDEASTNKQRAGLVATDNDTGDYDDPLQAAQQWFLGKSAKIEENTLGTSPVTEASEPDDSQLEFSDSTILNGLETVPSPLYSRGLDPSAASGVYPTPPDGIVPTILSDPATMARTNTDNTLDDNLAFPSDEPNEPLTEQATFEFDMHDSGTPSGDLFGDMNDTVDEDMFGAPDVTDADFNFFDELNEASAAEGRKKATDATLTTEIVAAGDSALALKTDQETSSILRHETNTGIAAEKQLRIGDGPALPTEGNWDGGGDSSIPGLPSDDNLGDRRTASPFGQVAVSPTSIAVTPPLSPFEVKERLLPLPIPASALRLEDGPSYGTGESRRSSSFGAVVFNRHLATANTKYGTLGRYSAAKRDPLEHDVPTGRVLSQQVYSPIRPSIKLSTSGVLAPGSGNRLDSPGTSDDETTYGDKVDEATESGTEATIRSPQWLRLTRKRKRSSDIQPLTDSFGQLFSEVDTSSEESEIEDDYQQILSITSQTYQRSEDMSERPLGEPTGAVCPKQTQQRSLPPQKAIWALFDFDGDDLINVAQIVMQQVMRKASLHADDCATNTTRALDAEQVISALRCICQPVEEGKVDLAKDITFASLTSMSASMTPVTVEPQTKGQPRPIPRRAISMGGGPTYGQYLFPVSSPLVRLRRAENAWDMLPSAIDFWDALGLEPSSGAKSVSAYAVLVGNEDMRLATQRFLQAFSRVYASCRLGTHTFEQAVSVTSGSEDDSIDTALKPASVIAALRSVCIELATDLARSPPHTFDQTTVLYIVDPFDDPSLTRYLCACAWVFVRELRATHNIPNFNVQLLPQELLATPGQFSVPTTDYMGRMARSVYDTCASTQGTSNNPFWRIPCNPSVRLVSAMARKINFALNVSPPNNLMQEAQILHLAYAVSLDGQWITAAWTDFTGDYQYSSSYSVANTGYLDVLTAVMDLTRSLMSNATTWRLVVVRVGSMSGNEQSVWRVLSAPWIAITLLDIATPSPIQIFPRSDSPADPLTSQPSNQPGVGFLTPASTPQASSQTVSPDAYGNNAPPTPAASENVQEPTAPDPDSHLIDARDETWALVLPFSTTYAADGRIPKRVLASGMLLKRGNQTPRKPLPSLGVDIVDNLPPKTQTGQQQQQQQQQSWLMPRTAEGVLREVLTWYRGLGLLAKLRDLKGCEDGNVPWHVAVAINGSKGLNGFLD